MQGQLHIHVKEGIEVRHEDCMWGTVMLLTCSILVFAVHQSNRGSPGMPHMRLALHPQYYVVFVLHQRASEQLSCNLAFLHGVALYCKLMICCPASHFGNCTAGSSCWMHRGKPWVLMRPHHSSWWYWMITLMQACQAVTAAAA